MNQTLERALEAYGGRSFWQKAQTIEAKISASGLAFVMKRRPVFEYARVVMEVHRPYCRIAPIGKDRRIAGVLDGQDVRLEDPEGRVIAKRQAARDYFPYGRRFFYWDDLDMAYFANYATWNYLTFPALLMRTDIQWREVKPGHLEARFPAHLPTHCETQHFFFDNDSGRLRQHNYTAEVIGGFAKAAHVVLQHDSSDGLAFTSVRRVTPLTPWGRPMPGPTLIDLRIHSFKVCS